jgi:hypothetical protein
MVPRQGDDVDEADEQGRDGKGERMEEERRRTDGEVLRRKRRSKHV